MLIHKTALLLKDIADRSDVASAQHRLDCIFLDQDKAFASDGYYYLMMVKNPPQELAEDYPSPPEASSFESASQAVLTRKTVERIEKNLPKNPGHPILNYILIGRRKGKVEAFLTDLDNSIQITQQDEEPEAPDIDSVLQACTAGSYEEIRLNLALLERVVKVLKKMQSTLKLERMPITVGVPKDKDKAFTIKVAIDDLNDRIGLNKLEAIALVMPLRDEE